MFAIFDTLTYLIFYSQFFTVKINLMRIGSQVSAILFYLHLFLTPRIWKGGIT